MPKSFIVNYVKNMTVNDLKKYALKNNVKVSDQDINTIYNYIQKYYNVFFDNPLFYIEKLKGNIDNNVYNQILIAYDEYKNYL